MFKIYCILEKLMEFTQDTEPTIKKPIIIAAMQDMGNVGSIVVNFINDSLRTKTFFFANPKINPLNPVIIDF